MDTNGNQFKMTYYVGAMLAHGGVLSIKDSSVVFSPGTVERAMGASDTVIPFDKIKMVEVTGTITESLMVRTLEKPHRFVGSSPYKIRDLINAAIERAYQSGSITASAPVPTPAPVAPRATVPTPAPVAAVSAAPATAPAPVASAPSVSGRVADRCPACQQPARAEFHFCPFCNATLKPSCSKCFRFTESGWKFCPFCSSNL